MTGGGARLSAGRRAAAAAAFGLALCLIACGGSGGAYLSSRTAEAVLDWMRQSDPSAEFADAWTVECAVAETAGCRVVQPPFEGDLGATAEQIVSEVGADYIVRAGGSVTIRCEKSGEWVRRWRCEIKTDAQWQSLPVR